jgi:hypothetical protein
MKSILSCLFFIFLSQTLPAQLLSPESVQIPMRDGKFLAGHLYRPDTINSYPVILIQTPYNKNLYQLTGLPLGIGNNLASSNYAFVIVDWRCFYGSAPACVLNANRGEDGYDTVEWIAEQDWCDGNIGTWGPSALGNVQYETAREHPPHLVCAMPEVSSPQQRYAYYYPGGSLITEHMQTLGVLFGSFNLVFQNPHYNLIWQIAESGSLYPEEIEVPMLLVGGWFDHNTTAVLQMMNGLRAQSPVSQQHKMLMGPWVHGGTGPAHVGSAQQGQLLFPEAEGKNIEFGMRFFDYHLRGIDNSWDTLAPYHYFQMGENNWHTTTSWPPNGPTNIELYLREDLSIQETPPVFVNANFSFNYDPEDPSPTVGGKTLSLGLNQGPYDQGPEVESRVDNLVFTTPVLTQDLEVKGTIKVHLYVSSDQLDTDISVRLTDVYPDGRSMLFGEGIQRMRFRNGYTVADTAFMSPGQVYPITIELDALTHTFLEGHQLRLIIAGSNYPRFNRNMNTGGEMYPNLNIDTLVAPLVAENSIYVNTSYPSRLELPLVGFTPSSTHGVVESQHIQLYPNPGSGPVRIESDLPLQTVQLFNATGQLIQTLDLNNALQSTLHPGQIPDGMYYLQITDSKGGQHRKQLIIQK